MMLGQFGHELLYLHGKTLGFETVISLKVKLYIKAQILLEYKIKNTELVN